MIIGINAIRIRVSSKDQVAGLLGQLGAREIAQGDGPGAPAAWAVGNTTLAVETADAFDTLGAGPDVHEAGLTHLCLQSRIAPDLKAGLEASGVRFRSDLITLGNGTWYAYGDAPAGFVVEVESADYAPEDAPEAWLSHVAFCTHDLERLSGFYARLTGRAAFGGRRVPPNALNDAITGLTGVDLKVAWVPCGNLLLEFWQYLNPLTEPRRSDGDIRAGVQGLVLEVSSMESALAHLKVAGASAVGAPLEDSDGRLRIEAADPDGNPLTFVSFENIPDDPRAVRRRPAFGWMAHLNEIRANLQTASFRPRVAW